MTKYSMRVMLLLLLLIFDQFCQVTFSYVQNLQWHCSKIWLKEIFLKSSKLRKRLEEC